MKSRRHRNGSAPFSLFSFQDIITGISGIMIFVLLILSLELTIPEEKKETQEDIRKTLFAEDPMEVFIAGKLELANSHTAMTKEEIMDLYLENGATYFKIKGQPQAQPQNGVDEGALNSNQPNNLDPNQASGPQNAEVGPQGIGQPPANAAGNSPGPDSSTPQTPADALPPPQKDDLKKTFVWLGENQNADGSWDEKHRHGITGLVVMAYLAYRERTGNPEFDSALQRGINFLVRDEGCNPSAEKFAYQNGIKTLALTEAVRIMGNNDEIEKAIKDSVTYIAVGQQEGGGFHYKYNTKTKTQDLSVAAWNLQAMHAADKLYSIDIARDGVERAKPWLTAMSKSFFTYNTVNHQPSANPKEEKKESMRAMGTWVTLVVNNENFENIKDDLAAIASENFDGLTWDTKYKHPLYSWNYATMCMMAAGGQFKEPWKKKLREMLLENQTEAGYWSPLRYRHGSKPFYTTAFCAHMLAMVYDYENAAYSGPPKGVSAPNTPATPPPVAANDAPKPPAAEETPDKEEIAKADDPAQPTDAADSSLELEKVKEEETPEGPVEGEFDNLISLDKNKAQEIKKRLNVFRRSIKSDSKVREDLENQDLEELNNEIVKFLNRKYFLEAQLNKMNKDPYIHDSEMLKDRYIHLNKEVTKLMKKIDLYEKSNSSELTLNPIKVFISSKDMDLTLKDGQKMRFSSTADGISDFKAWLQGRDSAKDVLLINIKPSGVSTYRKLDTFIELMNFKNLTTPVDENMEAE